MNEVKIEGIKELTDSLNELVRKYPDKAGELLEKDAKKLRKLVAKSFKEGTKSDGTSKRSLAKIGSYKVTKAQGIGTDQYVDISAKAPHFHLVENGHDRYNRKGEKIGWTEGKHIMRETAKKFESEMPQHIEDMIDELLKEGGLV